MAINAVIFDFGGVILTSPFEAFSHHERDNGLPDGFIRGINATNPDTNAWARLERSEVDLAGFVDLFEAEARAQGHAIDGSVVLSLLSGELRPPMVEAVRRCSERLRTGLLTNNFVSTSRGGELPPPRPDIAEVMALFDVVVESSAAGIRKPDPRIYELVCDKLGIEPAEAVFLDDLGINLKPARAMGMTTIKVVDPGDALRELETAVGFPLT
ncbi:MAG: HAD-IA family hydrolase [Acidimicrobiales bacterium]